MKEFLDVTVLAVLQGVAEFLPISSSGHLVILQHLLDVPENVRMRLEVFLHAGTLLSVFVFYRSRIGSLARGALRLDGPVGFIASWLYLLRLIVACLPAIVVYGLFHDSIESLVSHARLVGGFLMFTGLVLLATRFLPTGKKKVNFLRAFLMGLGQAIALLPGVSRSGLTLAAARGARVDAESAAEFSFLMSAPLILGGVLLECVKGEVSTGGLSVGVLLWGTFLSAVVGYGALALLLKALKGTWFWLFGPYCLLAGLCTVIFCR